MWRKHRVTKFSSWPVIGIFLLSTFLTTLSLLLPTQKAYAANFSPSKQAAAWNAGMALANCSNSLGWDKTQTGPDINAGGIFNHFDNVSGSSRKTVGYLVESSDGVVGCTDHADVKTMFSALDETPLDFLKKAGIYELNSDKTAYDVQLKDDAARAARIRSEVEKKFGFNYNSRMPDDMQYSALKAAFSKRCLANRDTNGVEVKIVKDDGTIETVKYVLKGGGNDVVEVGYSLDADGGNDQKMACTTIVQQMNKFAGAYSTTIKANIADDNPDNDTAADGGSDGLSDNNPTCESSGNPATWFLCPIFNGVAEFSDWLLRNLVEPLLRTAPVSTDPSNGSFRVWSSFRLYGNIILVISMLVIVFGQAIGGGIVDAYTAKKVMPRILIAAILVNTSIYIVAILVDLSNIVGGGIGQLMTAPFGDAAQFQFSPNASQSIIIAGGGASILAFLTAAIFLNPGLIGAAASFIGVFVLLPAVIGLIGAFVTLVIRQGIILTLILISPVAFALYCLPNTEKYFKKWWETLFKALLVYPIVIVIFAVADILAITIQEANGFGGAPLLTQTPANAIAAIIAFVAMFLPFMMIPWAFKMAGGLIGGLITTISNFGKKGTEFIKGNANDPNSLRNSATRRLKGESLRSRARFVRENSEAKGRLRSFAGRRMDYGNVLDKEAEYNEDAQRRMQRTTGSGDDKYIRARTSMALYRRADGGETTDVSQAVRDASGNAVRVQDKNGNNMRMSLNGQKRYTDYAYDKSKQIYRTLGEMQEAINYEAKKTLTDEDTDTFQAGFGNWMTQEGLTLKQGQGLYTGVAFARQNERLELKHSAVEDDGNGGFRVVNAAANTDGTKINASTGEVQQIGGRDAFVQELYDKKGSWAVSQMHDSTINQVAEAKESYAAELRDLTSRTPAAGDKAAHDAKVAVARDRLAKIQEMEESWVGDPVKMARQQAAASGGVIDEDGTPGYTGLSGAAQGVQAAARKMAHRRATIEVDEIGADGKPTGAKDLKDVTVRNKYDENGNRVNYAGEVFGPPRP